MARRLLRWLSGFHVGVLLMLTAISYPGCLVAPPIEEEPRYAGPLLLLPEFTTPQAIPQKGCQSVDVDIDPETSIVTPKEVLFSLQVGALEGAEVEDVFFYWYQYDLPRLAPPATPELSGQGRDASQFAYNACIRERIPILEVPPEYRQIELLAADQAAVASEEGQISRKFPEGTRTAQLFWCVQHVNRTALCTGVPQP